MSVLATRLTNWGGARAGHPGHRARPRGAVRTFLRINSDVFGGFRWGLLGGGICGNVWREYRRKKGSFLFGIGDQESCSAHKTSKYLIVFVFIFVFVFVFVYE